MFYSVTSDEHTAGAFSAEKLASIVRDIQVNGYAVVAGLVSQETCGLLGDSILHDAQQVRALNPSTPHEIATGKGHLQLGLRRYAPYVKRDLLANPLIENVVAAALGAKAWLGFYNGNVNLPGSTYQPLHFDRPFSWRTQAAAEQDGQSWPPPTTTLSCSVALTEITEANGATEIYPGTHLETAVTQWSLKERLSSHPELVERWGPPSRMPIPAGGICFRDPRMWHRGVPNPSNQVRPMIALTYHAQRCKSWRGRLIKRLAPSIVEQMHNDSTLKIMDDGVLGDGRLVFAPSAHEVLASVENPHDINRNVRFVPSNQHVNHFLDAHLVGGARIVEDIAEIAPVADPA